MTCPSAISASNRKVADAALCSEMGSSPPPLLALLTREHRGSSSLDALLSGLSLSPRSIF